MKINLKETFESLVTQQPGLSLFQFEKYWNWYLEIQLKNHPYSSIHNHFTRWTRLCSTGMPIAHILGQWGFYKDIFFVNNSTLIPRPETEMMVELALNTIKKPSHILEIGVGSGAALLSVMLHSSHELNCLGTDISASALQLCQKNYDAKKFRLEQHRFTLQLTDRTQGLLKNQYNLILCNPPYIPEHHLGVTKQVQQFEPASALYLPKDNYMSWMMELCQGIIDCLHVGGIAIIEGHEDYLKDIQLNLNNISPKICESVKIIQDLNQLDRFLQLVK